MNRDSPTPANHQVALAHDWLTGMRGGEKVLELLCRRFPKAPLWTLIHNPNTVSSTIANRLIHTSLLQELPFATEKYRQYLPFFPLFAETNKVSHADIVVSTSHAVAKSMVKRGRHHCKLHICYIHTPMRYAWDLFDETGLSGSGAPIPLFLQAYSAVYSVVRSGDCKACGSIHRELLLCSGTCPQMLWGGGCGVTTSGRSESFCECSPGALGLVSCGLRPGSVQEIGPGILGMRPLGPSAQDCGIRPANREIAAAGQ